MNWMRELTQSFIIGGTSVYFLYGGRSWIVYPLLGVSIIYLIVENIKNETKKNK